jgi:hypothetical protein
MDENWERLLYELERIAYALECINNKINEKGEKE